VIHLPGKSAPRLLFRLLTIHPELLRPMQCDTQSDLLCDPSLVAISSLKSLGVRVITAVD
jgi:hypothetical protein